MFYGYSNLNLNINVVDSDPISVPGIHKNVKYAFDNNIPILVTGVHIAGAKVGAFHLDGLAESDGTFTVGALGSYTIEITEDDTISFTS